MPSSAAQAPPRPRTQDVHTAHPQDKIQLSAPNYIDLAREPSPVPRRCALRFENPAETAIQRIAQRLAPAAGDTTTHRGLPVDPKA